MAVLTESERNFAAALSKLTHCNQFLPERLAFEREALGGEFIEQDLVWSLHARPDQERPNIVRLIQRATQLADAARARIADGRRPTPTELELYQDIIYYMLYYRRADSLDEMLRDPAAKLGKNEAYRQFEREYSHYLRLPLPDVKPRYEPHHLLASYSQIRRAFHHTFRYIIGSSTPAQRLRGAVWQSVFTNDIRRYQRCLYDRMRDFTTLIVGPSGTGKELVARAVALSRFIPFDPKTLTFVEDYRTLFHPLNLSALSPTLIESELFGHRRGAFTGALDDRQGWLEVCRPLGTVFLDEVGEIDATIQVKLLRVLQTRTFQRLGDTQTRSFEGKIIAATNRDLAVEMGKGRLREDFYYRLCSDVIVTPSLREMLAESPDEIHNLVLFIAHRIADGRIGGGPNPEAENLTAQVCTWINKHLGREYAWPGNFRELEQCVNNVLIRGEYRPAKRLAQNAREELSDSISAGSITADGLLRRYCSIVYAQTGSYEETARRLGLDRRTVKAKVAGDA